MDEWEIVPGVWIIKIFYEGEEMAEKEFQVKKAENIYELYGPWAERLIALKKDIEKTPEDVQVINRLGDLYLKLGEHSRAVKEFNRAIEISDDSPLPHVGRCRAYSIVKWYDKAIENCNEALELDSKHAPAYFYRADTYRRVQ